MDAPALLPGVEERHQRLDFWLETLAREHDLDEELLSIEDIDALNAGLAVPRAEYHGQADLLAAVDWPGMARKVEERRVWARDKLSAGEYVHGDGSAFTATELGALDAVVEVSPGAASPELRVALEVVPIHCAPMADGFFGAAPDRGIPHRPENLIDLKLDRNACSNLRPQQVVQVLGAWPNGMRLVRTRHSFGWIAGDAALSAPISGSLAEAYVHGVTLEVVDRLEIEARGRGNSEVVTLAAGTLIPSVGTRHTAGHVATARGFITTGRQHADRLRSTRRALTRRAVLEQAWRWLGAPYGLGGTDGGRDCSGLLVDVFESFGIALPRHSAWQARAGTFWMDVSKVAEKERLLLIDAAARKGMVLLSFPGHIMLYLGRNERGEPMALHAFREYLETCAPGQEILHRVPGVTVSTLEPGRGTSRTAFIERLTHITVIGKPPGIELGGVAELRPSPEAVVPGDRACKDTSRARIHVSPGVPNQGQPLRVVAALDRDPGPVSLTLVDPSGQRLMPEVVRLGGPPFGYVAMVDQPERGKWKAVLADGERVVACKKIGVRSRKPDPPGPNDGPIWMPQREWNKVHENLYALFVERLFDHPMDDDMVWPNLHTLLRDRERNILHGHLGLDEDERIQLTPDCADLPYTLRAYFAWKMRLPFGYRRCSRAREGRPPLCGEEAGGDNLMSRLELKDDRGVLLSRGEIEAFSLFVNSHVRNAVHSSSGRTSPDDDLTDFYPVPLTREALRPGTLFADPYGHLLVIVDWMAQGTDSYGILVGADAQPDGTVGRRRFWRGTFLFDPDTRSGGAGFKAFRPRTYVSVPVSVPAPVPADVDVNVDVSPAEGVASMVQRVGRTEEMLNEDLRKTRKHTRLSMQQYKGSADDFYAAVEGLINPRPLDAMAMQMSLVDALAESVARRISSVANGEAYMAEHGSAPIAMPEDEAIFLTSGPWEDFSTPSRDLRLLIAMDSVTRFPDMVRLSPGRFSLGQEDLDQVIAGLREALERELGRRTFTYTRSDGSAMTLTLADLLARSERLEVAYNPNDCIEVRWGAAPGSDEMATCRRRAPAEQQSRMEKYRAWFATRKRPPQ